MAASQVTNLGALLSSETATAFSSSSDSPLSFPSLLSLPSSSTGGAIAPLLSMSLPFEGLQEFWKATEEYRIEI